MLHSQLVANATTVTPLGTLKQVDLRSVWPHESLHFSNWLASNLEALSASLGLDLELLKREADVGPFALDILARVVGTEDRVVIENQLERTNHDHLGKLLTYAAGYDAKHIIWISSELREQHRAALDWLNNNTASDRNFFGILVEAIQIDDSKPAVSFRVAVSPNAFQKTAAQSARDSEMSADQQQINFMFEAIYERVKPLGVFSRLLRPLGYRAYYVVERTHKSVEYSVAFSKDNLRVEVVLNFAQDVNARLFAALQARADMIRKDVHSPLQWDFKEGRKRQVLRVNMPVLKESLTEESEFVTNWAAERLVEFRKVIEVGLQAEIHAAAQEVEQGSPT